MAISVVQAHSQAVGTGTTFPSSFSSTPTAGNAVIVLCAVTNDGGFAATGAVTDNQGNTYTGIVSKLDSNNSSAGSCGVAIYWCSSVSASGTFTVTCTPQTGSQAGWGAVGLIEASGIGAVDQTGAVNDGGTAPTSLTVTASGANTNANDLVVGCITNHSSGAQGGGIFSVGPTGYTAMIVYSPGSQGPASCGGYKIVSSGETSSMVGQAAATGDVCAGVLATFAPPVPLMGQILT